MYEPAKLTEPLTTADGAVIHTEDDALVFLLNAATDLRSTVVALVLLGATDVEHLAGELGVDVDSLNLPAEILEY